MIDETRMSLAAYGDDWTWTGKVFQTMEAATGNERRPIVVRRAAELAEV